MLYFRTHIAAALLSFGLVGCAGTGDAPPRAPVMGLVTLDGELLETGVIRFVPAQGTTGPQTTAVIDRGMFTLPVEHGPIVGTHRVEIDSTDTAGLAMDDERALERLASAPNKQKLDIVRVPVRYNEQSKLIARVPESGTSDLNFELVSTND
jgi:hypothetical protein